MAVAAKAWAFFKRDLSTDLSYRVSFALELFDILLGIGTFYFLASLFRDRPPAGYDAFGFILVGITANGSMTTALACLAQTVRSHQQGGTLKAALVTPTGAAAFLMLSAPYPLVRASLNALIYIVGGWVFGLSFASANLAAAAVVYVLALTAFVSLSVLSATFALVLKRGDPLLWLIGGLSWLLGGVFYPIDVLPPMLRNASMLLPITHALEALRATLLRGATLWEVRESVGVLALFASVSLPLSLVIFEHSIRFERRRGTLGHH